MTRPAVFHVRSVGSASLSVVLRPRGGDWLADHVRSLSAAGIRVLVSLLTKNEEDELEMTAVSTARGVSVPETPEQRCWLARFTASL